MHARENETGFDWGCSVGTDRLQNSHKFQIVTFNLVMTLVSCCKEVELPSAFTPTTKLNSYLIKVVQVPQGHIFSIKNIL
jgi:hypothetical protein